MLYDIIIVGGGPAGLTAAIYARRAEKSVLVLEAAAFGGQIFYTDNIENYPGISSVSGADFADALYSQAKSCGADMKIESVSAVKDGKVKTVISSKGEYSCKSVIIASGQKNRRLGADGEQRYIGSGVSFCAVCDGSFFKNRDVCVVGGGNTALRDALYLSSICKTVYLVHRRAEFRGERLLVSQLEKKPNVVFKLNSTVQRIDGAESVKSVLLDNGSGEGEQLSVSGVFVAVGQMPHNEPFSDVLKLDSAGYAESGEDCRTERSGIFVAGDCRAKPLRQLATAVSDGAVAATQACEYIDEQ